MTGRSRGVLYSPELLSLAVELARYPYDADLPLKGEARSRTCGSRIELSCLDRFADLGMRVSACAVGQAAAAIFAGGAPGKDIGRIAAAREQITGWLGGNGTLPDWPGIDTLAPALPHAGRHDAILLPWTAAERALSNAGGAS